MHYCTECGVPLSSEITDFSISNYGLPLCISHQQWITEMSNYSTVEAIRLYFALKQKGVPAELEKFDGFKHIDIAIPEAKVNIEVDGIQHNFDSRQALADLKRTYYSFLKGYHTIRIPNSLVRNDYVLNETAEYIVAFLNESPSKR